MYYAIVDPAQNVVEVVEADYKPEAIKAARDGYDGDGTLDAREAKDQEKFTYLVKEIGLSYAKLGKELGVSDNFVGQRVRNQTGVRRLDVLALERLRQLKEEEK